MTTPPTEPVSPSPADMPPAGWYPDPDGWGQRWWDGAAWGPRSPHVASQGPPAQQIVVIPPQEKSSGIAVLLTILWPGGGHLYLGLTQKAIPHVVANAIGFVLAWTVVLFPISFLIWLITLLMTVSTVGRDTDLVNDALRRGQRIRG